MRTFLLLLALAVAPALLAQERIVVEMEPVEGIGPLHFNWTGAGPATDPIGGQFDPLDDSVLALPEGLRDLDVRFEDLQSEEAYRRGYLKGNVRKAVYDRVRRYNSASRPPDSLVFDQRLDYAVGRDAGGNFAVVLDTDNDEDLSDESVYSVPWDGPPMSMKEFADSVMNTPRYNELAESMPAIEIQTEVLVDGRIVTIRRSVVIMPVLYAPSPGPSIPDKPLYLVGYAEHMRGRLTLGETTYQILANSGESLYRPASTWIQVPEAATITAREGIERPVGNVNPLRLGDVFELDGHRFRLDRISLLGDELELVDVTSRTLVSADDHAADIVAELVDGESFDLKEAGGKYVLLHFYSADCCGWFDEQMNETYEMVDKSCIEFVGIGEGEPDAVRDWTLARSVSWGQIADADGEIGSAYGVSAYPTYVLINPVGEVAATEGRFEHSSGATDMLNRVLPAACFHSPTAEDVTSVFWGDSRYVDPTDYFLEGCTFDTEEMTVRSVGDRNPERGWPATLDVSGECTGHEGAERQGTWHQDLTLNVWIYENMGQWSLLAREPFVVEQ